MTIPQQMHGLVLREYREEITQAIDQLEVAPLPVPSPGHGQVLVRVAAAACNPSDLLLLQGKYGNLKTLPTVPGWEGAGTVVSSGGGLLGRWLRGKRVACGLQDDRHGTWAPYVVVQANQCIPLKKDVSFAQAAGLIVNPLTAMGLLETARRNGHAAAVHTAGASQLGRMLIAIAAEEGFPLVNIVRREAQADLLHDLGAADVLNSTAEDFAERLRETCLRLQATAAFEAIGGELTGTVVKALPAGSTVYVYGALSEEACGNIDPIELIFRGKTVAGFYLGNWLQERGAVGVLRAANRVQRLLAQGVIQTTFQREVSLPDAPAGLRQYVQQMTAGKLLIRPQGDTADS